MRVVKIATWTWDEPVSLALLACLATISAFSPLLRAIFPAFS
jgi:hypothetical protein